MASFRTPQLIPLCQFAFPIPPNLLCLPAPRLGCSCELPGGCLLAFYEQPFFPNCCCSGLSVLLLWPHNQKIRKSSTVVSSSREPWMLTCQQHCGDKGIFGILISVLQPFHPAATVSQRVKGQNLTLSSITDTLLLPKWDSSFPSGWKVLIL